MRLRITDLKTKDGNFQFIADDIVVGMEVSAVSSIVQARLKNHLGAEFEVPCYIVLADSGRSFLAPCELLEEV